MAIGFYAQLEMPPVLPNDPKIRLCRNSNVDGCLMETAAAFEPAVS